MFLNAPGGHFFSEITFAPDREYLVCKLATRYVEGSGAKAKSTRYEGKVADYYAFEDGIVFPKLLRATRDSKPNEINEAIVKDLEVNQPIEDRELTLEFPPGAIVYDGNQQKFHIWGDGEPSRTFASNADFNEWNQRREMALMTQTPSGLPWIPAVALLAATALLIVLFLYRAKLRSRLGVSR